MPAATKGRALTLSIMGLIGLKKTKNSRLSHPERYFKNYPFDENMCNGIKLVADIEQCSKQAAAGKLIRLGFSKYMGAKVSEHLAEERLAREQNRKEKISRAVYFLRKYARAKGMRIKDFI